MIHIRCHRIMLAGFIACTILSGLGEVRADVADDVTAASDSVHATITTALKKADGGKLAAIFTDDAAVITPYGQSFEGRLTIRATASLMLTAFGSGKLTITRQSIAVVDGVPYETGQYRFTRKLEKKREQRFTGRYTLIWKREDGVWKVYRAIGIR